ncbi:MAG: HD-GYP domain-containing protein [Coriobacteriia bacterium]
MRITLVVGIVGLSLRGMGEVLVAALAAGVIDATVRVAQDGMESSIARLLDVIRSVSVLALLSPWQRVLQPMVVSPTASDTVLIIAMIAGGSYALVDITTLAIQQSIAGGTGVPHGTVSLVRPLGAVYMVHIAMAAVVLRVYPSLGPWGLVIALLLTLILQNSFNLYLRIRRAYAQTIKALAHAAELDRPEDAGHAERVSDLAVAVGRLRGLSSTELERVGYAALLHDIGRIGYDSADAGQLHPTRGAEIVGAVPFLEGVAPIIEQYRETDQRSAPEGAVIVGVCCRYDRLRARIGVGAALEQLRTTEEHRSLRVVHALVTVIQRQSAAAGAPEGMT